ncbi:MAG: hypothetical protein GQ565_01345 [Candidatus Aegiribacteria sp.]|nr:hypothetical protein [Candidatus Aegiribacteria sp.]
MAWVEGPPCAHYLPVNRFEWWNWYHEKGIGKNMLPHGGLAPQVGDNQEEAVNSIFCSTLATFVGTNLDEIRGVVADRISWDSLPVGASANEVIGIEYSVRTIQPGCVPKMKELVIRNRNSKLLVNCPADERPEPDQPPPPLTINFTVPQRAVCLEYGRWADMDPEWAHLRASRIILIARDQNGNVITNCDGTVFYGDDDFTLSSGGDTRMIGLADRNGGICSIELEFTQNTGHQVLDPPYLA